MTIQVNIGEAKTRLSELLAKVDQGEPVIIARRNVTMYEVKLIEQARSDEQAAIERLLELREHNEGATREEIREWIDEGRA